MSVATTMRHGSNSFGNYTLYLDKPLTRMGMEESHEPWLQFALESDFVHCFDTLL